MAGPAIDERGFTWPVSRDGYHIANVAHSGESYKWRGAVQIITDGHPNELYRINSRFCNPLTENPAPFLDLAWAEGDEGLLLVANRIGFLGSGITEEYEIPSKDQAGETITVPGESLDIWRIESIKMRHAVSIWSLVKSRDSKELSSYLMKAAIDEDPVLGPFLSKKKGTDRATDDVTNLEIGFLLRTEDDFFLAASYLRDSFAKHIDHHLKISAGQFEQAPRFDPWFYLVPDSMLSALWVDLALAIDSGKEFARCKVCRRGFTFMPAGNRIARQYCSDSCRLRAYRDRQKEARRLHKEGLGIEQISKSIGASEQAVKGWLETK